MLARIGKRTGLKPEDFRFFKEPAYHRLKVTEALYNGLDTKGVRHLPLDMKRKTLNKLDVLNAAKDLLDLRSPPGNRLEALKGDLSGYYSIRVNDQWRIIFRWQDGNAYEVQLTDYH